MRCQTAILGRSMLQLEQVNAGIQQLGWRPQCDECGMNVNTFTYVEKPFIILHDSKVHKLLNSISIYDMP